MRFRIVRQTTHITVVPGATETFATPAVSFTNPEAPTGLPLNGLLQGVTITTPAAVDGSATMTVNLIDQDGNTVWTKGSLAVNTVYPVLLTPNATANTNQAVPLSGYYQVSITFSANQTTTASVTKIVLLIDEG
jgi:hypothetical protein